MKRQKGPYPVHWYITKQNTKISFSILLQTPRTLAFRSERHLIPTPWRALTKPLPAIPKLERRSSRPNALSATLSTKGLVISKVSLSISLSLSLSVRISYSYLWISRDLSVSVCNLNVYNRLRGLWCWFKLGVSRSDRSLSLFPNGL